MGGLVQCYESSDMRWLGYQRCLAVVSIGWKSPCEPLHRPSSIYPRIDTTVVMVNMKLKVITYNCKVTISFEDLRIRDWHDTYLSLAEIELAAP